ncbi:MAG: lipopolysaccharide transport periplasmic protein LptA, partial [Telluria sp.]|nr:lipopolysaccharide transport periplasmic protein LptA [Telluria sp.]
FTSAQIRQLEGARPTDEIQAEYISYDSLREVFLARNDASGETKPGKGRGRMIIAPRKPRPAAPATPATGAP